MAERLPLLIFPDRITTQRSKLHGGSGNIQFPTHTRQIERIGPQIQVLETALRNKTIHLIDTTTGLDPEEVLVLEIAGEVADFIKAVNSVEGLDWLGEYDTENSSDSDFYDTKDKRKAIGGKVYLTASNATAIEQLMSLWHIYEGSSTSKFPLGQAPIKHMFEQLRAIRLWNANDRLFEEDVDFWLTCIEQYPETPVNIEIELWYRGTDQKRESAENSVSELVANNGGRIVSKSLIPEIRYHSLLAEVPGGTLRGILSNIDSNELVQNNNIMLFRPSGQQIPSDANFEEAATSNFNQIQLKDNNPRIAIFDGVPLENHDALWSGIIVDDPDDFTSSYSVHNRTHGTQMCSLVIRGDLALSAEPIDTPVYLRPIMKPNLQQGGELIPDNILFVDLIHRAVKRIKEGEDGNPPTAPMVKVINFSIGDPRRIFYNSMSPMARLLDWLSWKYDILFIISAGNVSIPFRTPSLSAFNTADRSEQSRQIFSNLIEQRSESRLIAPAESINNITVGATHTDFTSILPQDRRFNPYDSLMPAIYTRIGSGYRKAVKPDLVYSGGRQLYDEIIISNSDIHPSLLSREPGIKVAVPDTTRKKTSYQRGTSHATALITHNASYCINTLEKLGIPDEYQAVLIKAMLAHGCSWDDIEHNIRQYLTGRSADDQKKIITQWIGYGIPNFELSLFCNAQRATAIAYDEISVDTGHIYHFPLPPSLATKTNERRLTVTLSWLTPINAASQKYRNVKLWFETPSMMTDFRFGPDWQKVKNGTLQHEVFDGDSAQAFVDGDCITIKVNCAKDASSNLVSVKYALMVSLEVKEDIELPIYQEVAERISTKIPVIQQ